jgi:hypothetical protein
MPASVKSLAVLFNVEKRQKNYYFQVIFEDFW